MHLATIADEQADVAGYFRNRNLAAMLRLLPSQGAAPTNTAWHPSFATRFNSRTAKPGSRNEICAAGISRSLCEEQISSAHVLYARQSASASAGSLTAASHSRPTVG